MEFEKKHLSFYKHGVKIDELAYGEMFITSKLIMTKPIFFLGIERRVGELVKFKFKAHGDPKVQSAVWKVGTNVYRRAY